jgi:hypothetical protein
VEQETVARCSETGSKKGKTQEQDSGAEEQFLILINEGGIA